MLAHMLRLLFSGRFFYFSFFIYIFLNLDENKKLHPLNSNLYNFLLTFESEFR